MFPLVLIGLFLFVVGAVNSAPADVVLPRMLYVAATGNDGNPGTPDRPFATLARAKAEIRRWIAIGLNADVQVLLRSGTYELTQALTFDPQDSGTLQHSITYTADAGEKVVISGGRRISGWQQKENGLWSVDIPEVAAGQWYFRELYVNGRRASRTRSPSLAAKEPFLRLLESKFAPDRLTWEMKLAPPGRTVNWKNLTDLEFVAFRQREIARLPLCSVAPESAALTVCPLPGTAPNALPSAGTLGYLENSFAFLRQPGEWYLDRANGELRYWPRADEDLTQAEVIAPVLTQLIQITGSRTNPVQNLHFRGLTLSHATCLPPAGGFNGVQAGFYLLPTATGVTRTNRMDAAICFEFAEACSIENCEIAHVGGSAVELRRGCCNNLLEGNHLQDVGANGLMVGEGSDWTTSAEAILNNRLVNNLIHHCGVTDFGAVGMWVGFAQGTLVAHNMLRDLPGTGISVGWQWGKQETNCRTNQVWRNQIYNIGLVLTDVGGIYTAGRQPGTIIRENVLHDLDHGRQPVSGLYFDEGSPDGFLVESNLVYDTAGPWVTDKAWNAWRTNDRFRANTFVSRGAFPLGVVGVGMLFTNDSYLDLVSKPALEPTNLTVEAWVKFLHFPIDSDPCVWIVNKNGDELTDGNYAMAVSHRNVGAYLNIGGGRDNCFFAWSSGNPILSKGWNHLAMTYDGHDLKVYCNGTLQNSKSISPRLGVGIPTSDVGGCPRTTGTGNLRIGKRDDNSAAFSGVMDEIRIYNRPLCAEEISSQFSAISNQIADASLPHSEQRLQSKVSSLESNCVAYWPFDDMREQMERTIAVAGPEVPYRSRWHLDPEKTELQQSKASGQRPIEDSK